MCETPAWAGGRAAHGAVPVCTGVRKDSLRISVAKELWSSRARSSVLSYHMMPSVWRHVLGRRMTAFGHITGGSMMRCAMCLGRR